MFSKQLLDSKLLLPIVLSKDICFCHFPDQKVIKFMRTVYFTFCTAAKKVPETFSVPRLSSSILLCRKNQIFLAPYDYEVLMLKRVSQRSFANALAFPGGRVDEEDITNTAPGESLMKTTALRELFEQTGIFLSKTPIVSQEQISFLAELHTQLTTEALQGSVHLSKVYEKLCKQFQLDRSLQDVIRLITIPTLPVRYDTTFFSKMLTPHHYLNIHSVMARGTSRLQDTDRIVLDDYEHCSYEWLTPVETLKRYYKKELLLVPPQFILMNIMAGFSKYQQSMEFFKSLKNKGPQNNGIDNNALFYPQIVNLVYNKDPETTKKYPFAATFVGDKDYAFDKLTHNEKSEPLKNQLIKYREIFGSSTGLNRFLFRDPKLMFQTDYEIKCTVPFSPLAKMMSYENLKKKFD